jgi:hypothetical protein
MYQSKDAKENKELNKESLAPLIFTYCRGCY